MTEEKKELQNTEQTKTPKQKNVPQEYNGLVWLAEMAYASKTYPESYIVWVDASKTTIDERATKARIFIGMLKAKEVGLDPLTGLSTIYVINGKPTIYGDGATALIQQHVSDYEETFTGTENTREWQCTVTIHRKGVEKPYVGQFSWGDAIDAGLTGKPGPWKYYKKRMLKNRARAYAIRDGFSDCLHGLSIYEEEIDIQKEAPRTEDKSFLDDELPALTHQETPQADLAVKEKEPEKVSVKLSCAICNGRGIVETEEGKEPCKDCNQ